MHLFYNTLKSSDAVHSWDFWELYRAPLSSFIAIYDFTWRYAHGLSGIEFIRSSSNTAELFDRDLNWS